jgi:uncharacterized surface protein with fasciclin (FAS1) repeats
MKISRYLVITALLVAIAAVPMTHAQEHPTSNKPSVKAEKPTMDKVALDADSIVGVASEAGNLGTFVTAVKAAGLTGKLQEEGPFTIFAPTDEAFAKLPEGALEDLLKPANRSKLAGILACHVVPGKLLAKDVKTMKATNVSGQDLDIEVHDGAVTVDGAKVVEADLVADNGVIHVIDRVIMPKDDAKSTSDKPKDHPAH